MESATDADKARWVGRPAVRGSSQLAQMVLLTVSVAGLQFTWGVETTYVTTYLMSLGMPKAVLSIVWIAGPVSGLVMQPVVGVLSDKSTSRYGRRRPYMVLGTVIVSVGLCGMAWAPEIASVFVEAGSPVHQTVTLVMATAFIFVTDFAINAVQACCRALIVDVLPPSKQELGNGWAGRMIAAGHLTGYFLGLVNLTHVFGGMLGDTQLKSLCVLSSLALAITVGITSYAASEAVLIRPPDSAPRSPLQEIAHIARTLVSTVWNVPERIGLILKVQFCAWYGWFTFLFYSAAWVGEVFVKHGDFDDSQEDVVGQIGRTGSRALVVFSTTSLLCTIILPELLRRDLAHHFRAPSPVLTTGSARGWATFAARKLTAIASIATYALVPLNRTFERANIQLIDIWIASHFVYAAAAFLTVFVTSVGQATCLMVLWGFSWSIVTWAPFSLLGEEILRLGDPAPKSMELATIGAVGHDEAGLGGPVPVRDDDSHDGGQAGVYLGIHNVALTIPQLISTFVSFVIFSFTATPPPTEGAQGDLPAKAGEGDGGQAIARTFQMGTVTALIAAYFTFQLKHKLAYVRVSKDVADSHPTLT